MAQTTFAIVGSGWRARFFARLAKTVPDRLRVAGVVTRSVARAEAVAGEWAVPAYVSIDDLLAHDRPDFVIVSVPWAASPAAIRELVARDIKVLAETPPAPDVDGLRQLWTDVGGSGLVQVAEQYLLMPGHAARLALVRAGVIGTATSVQVSSTHLYHAVSMMRGFLGIDFGPAEVNARAFVAPLADPLSPAGWSGDDTPKPAATTLATVDLDGFVGVYDFTDNQWWNPLRARRIVVRGSRGEIVDDTVTRLLDPTTPVSSTLTRRQTGLDLNLEGLDLKYISFDGSVVYPNPFVGSGMSDDDIAVAAIAVATGAWARGEGPAPYPLAEACEDHLIALAIEQSARELRPITTAREAWTGPAG
jgi:predicted dehydrogenase